jgi:hypothetical protein
MFALQFLNMVTVVFALNKLTGVWYLPSSVHTFMLLLMSLFGFNYFATGRGRKHLAILKQFENETKEERRKRGIFFWAYVLGSFVAAVCSLLWAFS